MKSFKIPQIECCVCKVIEFPAPESKQQEPPLPKSIANWTLKKDY
jgi:hypothetical protein